MTQHLRQLLTESPIEVQDIFDIAPEDMRKVPSKTFDDSRSKFTNQVEQSKITESWRDYSDENRRRKGLGPIRIIEQVNPLQLGRFYLATGWNWTTWHPWVDLEGLYRDEILCVVYLLTEAEKKRYFLLKENVVTLIWPVRWEYPTKGDSRVVLKSDGYIGQKESYGNNEGLLGQWLQMIPLWTLAIPTPSLNYPRLKGD